MSHHPGMVGFEDGSDIDVNFVDYPIVTRQRMIEIMTPLFLFLDPLLRWLDARCLTKLLMTGDQTLKTVLQKNVTEVVQYYHADPKVYIWQFPVLALTSFKEATRVVLVTDSVCTNGSHDDNEYRKYHRLQRVDYKLLPRTVTDLVLKFGGMKHHSWEGVDFPNLQRADLGSKNSVSQFSLPATISSKLINQLLPSWTNNIAGVEAAAALTVDTEEVKIHFSYGKSDVGILGPCFARHHQLSSLSLRCVIPIVNLLAMPRTLTKLCASSCRLLNHTAIELFPLTVLVLKGNIWYEQKIAQGSNKSVVHEYDGDVTINCPSMVLKVHYSSTSKALLRLPNSVTDIDYRATNTILEFHEPDAILPGLQNLGVTLMVTRIMLAPNIDISVLDNLLGVIRKSPNLKFADLLIERGEVTRSIILELTNHCPKLEKVVLLTGERFSTEANSYPSYILPRSIVECDMRTMFYQQNLLITGDYANLRILTISVDMSLLEKFNCLLQELRQLSHLELRLAPIFADNPQPQYDLSLSAPPSLTSLLIEVVTEDYKSPTKSLTLRFAGEEGIPPKMRSIHMTASNVECTIHPTQLRVLPTTLEWLYPRPPRYAKALTRLHNLVVKWSGSAIGYPVKTIYDNVLS